jgi:phage gp29-like protein
VVLDIPIDAIRKQVKKLGSLLPRRRAETDARQRIIRPWREDTFHAYPSVGLTPARVLSFLHAADAGSPQMQFELFGEMLQKWPRLAAVEATRRLALTGLDWEIEPGQSSGRDASSGRAAEEAAEYCRTILASIERFRDVLDHLANAIGHGIAVAELVWDSGKLIDLVPVPYSRLISDVNEPWRLRVRTEEEQSVGVALDEHPAKWIVHQPRAVPGRAACRSASAASSRAPRRRTSSNCSRCFNRWGPTRSRFSARTSNWSCSRRRAATSPISPCRNTATTRSPFSGWGST